MHWWLLSHWFRHVLWLDVLSTDLRWIFSRFINTFRTCCECCCWLLSLFPVFCHCCSLVCHFSILQRCYKIIFGLVNLSPSDFFQFRVSSVTRGHPYKILRPHSSCTARATFFTERIINTWNSLPHDSIDFSSLHAFQRGIEENDFSRFLCLC